MERRLLLAILLTFLVLTVYQWMLPKPPPTTAAIHQRSSAACVSEAAQAARPARFAHACAAAAPQLPPVETVLADTAEKTVAVDNGVVRAVFSNRGGTLVSWQLADQYQRLTTGRPSIWFRATCRPMRRNRSR